MVKGLSDLRTAITTRVHSKPSQKGTAHLDLYLLSRERERLEGELSRLRQRQGRLQEHLREIHKAMDSLKQAVEGEGSAHIRAGEKPSAPASPDDLPPWKKMSLDY